MDSPPISHLNFYGLFSDSYVESLLTSHLKQEGVHVYVANVRSFIKVKTDEGKEYYVYS